MKFIRLIILTLISNTLLAQNNNQLKLYAVIGTQINPVNSNFNTTLINNLNSFSMGAGSNYYLGNIFLGTEFLFSNGKESNQDYNLNFSGLNSTFSIGCNIIKARQLQIEPQIGFLMSNNRMIKDDYQLNKTAYFDKNNLGLTPAISFNYKNKSNMTYGLKGGVNLGFNKKVAWENGIDKSISAFPGNTNSVFLQASIGGVLNFKKKKQELMETGVSAFSYQPLAGEENSNIVHNNKDNLFSTIYPNSKKETIIMLHGGPGFPDDLKEVVAALKNDFQIITFHQRGTKKSPCISGDYSINAYIDDIDSVAKFYGITKFHLWGHSWGGLYAQIYADKHSQNLLSLFLCCPGSGTNIQWKQTEKEVMQLNKSKCTNWEWSKMGINNLLGMMGSDQAYKRLFKQVMKNYNDDFVKTEKPGIHFDNLKAAPINKTRREIVKYPILNKLENPNYKITIVYGDQDIYKSSKNFVIDRYPTAKLWTIKNCGHIPWLHNPKEYKTTLEHHYKNVAHQ